MPEPIDVYAAAVTRGGLVLLARRTRPASLAGLFEFPGGKRELDEEPKVCLVRELHEELGYGIEVGVLLGSVLSSDLKTTASSTGPLLRLTAYSARPVDLHHEPELIDGTHDELRWVSAPELLALTRSGALAPLDVPLVPATVSHLNSLSSP